MPKCDFKKVAYIYIYIYIYLYICMYIYIYIYLYICCIFLEQLFLRTSLSGGFCIAIRQILRVCKKESIFLSTYLSIFPYTYVCS